MCKEIPLLKANQVELRVQRSNLNGDSKYAQLLVYKNARTDMDVLDECFGWNGWKRYHNVVGNKEFCTVAVKDKETGEWIEKMDVGTPSKAESDKGESSDAFKRACVNFGIGRELYSAPDQIYVNLTSDDLDKSGQKIRMSFYVAEMEYDKERREFKTFIVVDDNDMVRFDYRNYKKQYLRQPYPYGGNNRNNNQNKNSDNNQSNAQPVAQKQSAPQPNQTVAQQTKPASAENNFFRILGDGTIEVQLYVGKPYAKWVNVKDLAHDKKDWVLKHPKEYGPAATWLQNNQ